MGATLLVMAMRDPDVQVRAHAAHALARLDSLPAEAIPLLIAASCLLATDPGHASASAVLVEALSDPAVRIWKASLELVGTLDTGSAAFRDDLKKGGVLSVLNVRQAFSRTAAAV